MPKRLFKQMDPEKASETRFSKEGDEMIRNAAE